MVFGTGLLTPDVQVCADGLLDELDVHPHPAPLWCSLVALLLCSARWKDRNLRYSRTVGTKGGMPQRGMEALGVWVPLPAVRRCVALGRQRGTRPA